MAEKLTGLFETRREAEMTVERLVQEFNVDRTDISVLAAGAENTVAPIASAPIAAASLIELNIGRPLY